MRNIALSFLRRFNHFSLIFKLKLLYISVYNFIKYRDFRFPQAIWIETSTQCNRACYYCPNSVAPIKPEFISIGIFNIIISRLKQINWAGPVGYHYLNEPLLNPEICFFIEKTKRELPKSMPIIFTNGDLLTMELADRLVKSGVERVAITQHPPLKPGWEERIKLICDKYPYIFTYSKIDKKELMNIAGVVAVNNPKLGYCNSPKRVLPIRINGDISICCCDYKHENIEGNVIHEPILDIWRGNKKWKKARKELRNGGTPYSICKNCTGAK